MPAPTRLPANFRAIQSALRWKIISALLAVAQPSGKPEAADPLAQRFVTGSSQMLDVARTKKLVDQRWSDEIVPALVEYIKIPNKSPAFDPDWAAHGYMDEAVTLFERWARAKLPSLPGSSLEVVRLPGRT